MKDTTPESGRKPRASRRDPELIKGQGWREQRILVVSADDPRLDALERRFVEALAERLYGTGRNR